MLDSVLESCREEMEYAEMDLDDLSEDGSNMSLKSEIYWAVSGACVGKCRKCAEICGSVGKSLNFGPLFPGGNLITIKPIERDYSHNERGIIYDTIFYP